MRLALEISLGFIAYDVVIAAAWYELVRVARRGGCR